ncbi:hypothetical protein K435DRAFT_790813 [Dendrothele bispora CBS 962.96]|uniref:Uncharacterized protein n=1 Tax=Dendrothele bispora (strain CBS 962.96) TaxID=1314807 RepID=A0A4S8MNN7_DENBC|nr:hypothetical protein K435DRAFT_790813 [Dendrothele bispora CBS 962.96]
MPTINILAVMLVMSVEYFLYGLYTTLFILSIWILRHVPPTKNMSPASSKTNQLHLTSLVVIFILTTFAVILHSVLNGQLILQQGASRESSFPRLISNLTIATLLICLITRSSNQICVFGFIISPQELSGLSHVLNLGQKKKGGSGSVYHFCVKPCLPQRDKLKSHQGNIFEVVFFMINLVNNIVITSLNAQRIWKIDKGAKSRPGLKSSSNYFRKVIRIIVQSGILYTVTHVVVLIVIASQSQLFLAKPTKSPSSLSPIAQQATSKWIIQPNPSRPSTIAESWEAKMRKKLSLKLSSSTSTVTTTATSTVTVSLALVVFSTFLP